jgi:hypothetical protein
LDSLVWRELERELSLPVARYRTSGAKTDFRKG